MRIVSWRPIVVACFDVNRTVLVDVALIRWTVRGVVDEYLLAFDVQKRSPICGFQVGGSENLGG